MPALRPLEPEPKDSADVEAQRLLGRQSVRSSRSAPTRTRSNGNSSVGGTRAAGGTRTRGGSV